MTSRCICHWRARCKTTPAQKNQPALRSLLAPLQMAAEQSAWMRAMLDSRRIFQPQAWSPAQAFAFLRETPALEQCGLITRIPNWWKNGKGPRPQVNVRVGEKKAAGLGVDALLDFAIETTLDGETLSEAEWQALMQSRDGLVSLRGQWVEVDREKLNAVLAHWKQVQRGEFGEGVSFLEAMRLLSGARLDAQPALFFTLRGVDMQELIVAASAGATAPLAGVDDANALAGEDLSALFGVEIEATPAAKGEKKTKKQKSRKQKSKMSLTSQFGC